MPIYVPSFRSGGMPAAQKQPQLQQQQQQQRRRWRGGAGGNACTSGAALAAYAACVAAIACMGGASGGAAAMQLFGEPRHAAATMQLRSGGAGGPISGGSRSAAAAAAVPADARGRGGVREDSSAEPTERRFAHAAALTTDVHGDVPARNAALSSTHTGGRGSDAASDRGCGAGVGDGDGCSATSGDGQHGGDGTVRQRDGDGHAGIIAGVGDGSGGYGGGTATGGGGRNGGDRTLTRGPDARTDVRSGAAAASLVVAAAAAAIASDGGPTASAASAAIAEGKGPTASASASATGLSRVHEALVFLYRYLPRMDADASLPLDYLQRHVDLALEARAAAPWAAAVPWPLFLEAVLPHASLDEPRDEWRPLLRAALADRVADAGSLGEAAQRVNRDVWGIWNITFRPEQTPAIMSPTQVIKAGYASCTGLSIFLVDACRSVGIPARVVGTPKWLRYDASKVSGNHDWVEVWDGSGWSFTGAAEYSPEGLNRSWFVPEPAAAQVEGSREHAIYAARYKPAKVNATWFPLAWSAYDGVPAEDVTRMYTARADGAGDATAHGSHRAMSDGSFGAADRVR